MRTASFHASRLPRTRANCSYGAVGDKDKDYVVTADGNVYYQKAEWWGGTYEYVWEYSAATKTESGFWQSYVFPDIEGDQAVAIRNNIVAAYDIYDDAKAYADTLYASTQASGTTPPTTTVPTTGGGTTVPSDISTPSGGGTPPPPTTPTVPAWVWPAVAVVAIGGVTAVVIGAAGKKKKAEEAK